MKHKTSKDASVLNFLADGKKTPNYKKYARNINSNKSSVMQSYDGVVKCFENAYIRCCTSFTRNENSQ